MNLTNTTYDTRGPFDPDVEVTGDVQLKDAEGEARTKTVIVAVHGVGDQMENATIQTVVKQFCGFYEHPSGVALGNFRSNRVAFSPQAPFPHEPFQRFAFAEVYWAKVPRALVAEKYSLEDTKNWARTIVERLRLRWMYGGKSNLRSRPADFRLLNQVLGQMIQTVAVLDRICMLAEKAGLFSFKLKTLLDDYVGDVQIVAEFAPAREDILRTFSNVMTEVHAEYPDAAIHIVSHSEGTVVSMLGLLAAFRESSPPAWSRHVRGLMTLGSPIDKHLMLWPELFGAGSPSHVPPRPIEWRNYYDYGDPIGFSLVDTRSWISHHGWSSVFNFTDAPGHDNGFGRYPFAGKAHVDYWHDDAVFGHYIQTVLGETPPAAPTRKARNFAKPPANILSHQILSYIVPFAAVAALSYVAAFLLIEAADIALWPDGHGGLGRLEMVRSTTGFGTLLLGFIVASRIPRLTREVSQRAIAVLFGIVSFVVYAWSGTGGQQEHLFGRDIDGNTYTMIEAMIALTIVFIVSAAKPMWGLKPMIAVGGIAVGVRMIEVAKNAPGHIWPVVLALLLFLYIWWLAALLFELTYVWHRYIRHSRANQRMSEIVDSPY